MAIAPLSPYGQEFHLAPYNPLAPENITSGEYELFYRANPLNAPLEAQLAMIEQGELSVGDMGVPAWQQFVDRAWKTEHNTPLSTERWKTKIEEEFVELERAVRLGDAEKVTDEGGDLAFVLTALQNNDGGAIQPSFRKALRWYTDHVRVIKADGTEDMPSWRKYSVKVANKPGAIRVKHIDRLAEKGFEPVASVAFIFEGEQSIDLEDALMQLELMCAMTRPAADISRRYRQRFDPEVADDSSAVFYDSALSDRTTHALLLTTHVLHLFGSSLEAALERNMQKVPARIKANRLDKSDGERSGDLL